MAKFHLTLLFVAISLAFSFLAEVGSCRTNESGTNSDPAIAKKARLTKGIWGGQHVRMEVTESGAQIEYDCAHGTIDEPIIIDRRGRFDVKGKFTREHGGPIRGDEEPKSSPVRYVGEVKGKTLDVTITNTQSGEKLGTFTLTQGSEGRIMKCR